MRGQFRILVMSLVIGAMVMVSASPAFARSGVSFESELTPPLIDLATRPIGVVATAGGAVLCIPALALTAIVAPRDWRVPVDILIARPAKYTFVDRLGAH